MQSQAQFQGMGGFAAAQGEEGSGDGLAKFTHGFVFGGPIRRRARPGPEVAEINRTPAGAFVLTDADGDIYAGFGGFGNQTGADLQRGEKRLFDEFDRGRENRGFFHAAWRAAVCASKA